MTNNNESDVLCRAALQQNLNVSHIWLFFFPVNTVMLLWNHLYCIKCYKKKKKIKLTWLDNMCFCRAILCLAVWPGETRTCVVRGLPQTATPSSRTAKRTGESLRPLIFRSNVINLSLPFNNNNGLQEMPPS